MIASLYDEDTYGGGVGRVGGPPAMRARWQITHVYFVALTLGTCRK